MPDKRLRIILPILCVLWICMIFFMSSDANSYNKTYSFSEGVSSQIHGTEVVTEIEGNKDGNTEVDLINSTRTKYSWCFFNALYFTKLIAKEQMF